jgi:hypothetical protein
MIQNIHNKQLRSCMSDNRGALLTRIPFDLQGWLCACAWQFHGIQVTYMAGSVHGMSQSVLQQGMAGVFGAVANASLAWYTMWIVQALHGMACGLCKPCMVWHVDCASLACWHLACGLLPTCRRFLNGTIMMI